MILPLIKSAAAGVSGRWRILREREDIQKGLKFFQYGLLAIIVLYLVYKLTHLGWAEVIGSLPESPWFYLFFLLRFLALPISELAIYEIVWSQPLVRHFFVFIRKRVYNFAVMGYSGEAFLTLWARRRLSLPHKKILIGVKDNNLLSAFTSNAATVILIVLLAATGGLKAGLDAFPGARWLFALAFLSAGTLSVLVMTFRDKLMALPKGVMPRLIGVHGGRQALIILLHAAMYASALPGAPIMAWMTFIAMQLVLSRVPFLPNQDIVYLGAALSLSPIVGAPEAMVAGMLVAEAGLSQIFNIAMFFATAHLARTETGAVKA
ncbi:hypothetical protein [Hyphococcus sp.]|uniref:hypothetical protein n=1 Tax=Hyphococcus sp. TaxID=2038636 RepID=UPI0020816FDB|nr:MAG: hypothetical protein DHS20C04_19910 [Marinicaulis sp.]